MMLEESLQNICCFCCGFCQEPNKEKTEHNGSVPSGDSRDAVVKHSPKSVGSLMSPGPGPPGSVALPGLVSHSATGVSVTVTNGSGPGRALYSPDSDPSPPTPQPPGPPGQHGHQRPVSLGTRAPGDHRATGQVNEAVNPLSIDPNERVT